MKRAEELNRIVSQFDDKISELLNDLNRELDICLAGDLGKDEAEIKKEALGRSQKIEQRYLDFKTQLESLMRKTENEINGVKEN